MILIDTALTLYPPAKAESVARELQKGDPDWIYVVKHDPTGKGLSFIEIYDEHGEFVSRF